MGLRGDWFKVATCAASTAIWIATCGRPDVADVKKLQRVQSPLPANSPAGFHRHVQPVPIVNQGPVSWRPTTVK